MFGFQSGAFQSGAWQQVSAAVPAVVARGGGIGLRKQDIEKIDRARDERLRRYLEEQESLDRSLRGVLEPEVLDKPDTGQPDTPRGVSVRPPDVSAQVSAPQRIVLPALEPIDFAAIEAARLEQAKRYAMALALLLAS